MWLSGNLFCCNSTFCGKKWVVFKALKLLVLGQVHHESTYGWFYVHIRIYSECRIKRLARYIISLYIYLILYNYIYNPFETEKEWASYIVIGLFMGNFISTNRPAPGLDERVVRAGARAPISSTNISRLYIQYIYYINTHYIYIHIIIYI